MKARAQKLQTQVAAKAQAAIRKALRAKEKEELEKIRQERDARRLQIKKERELREEEAMAKVSQTEKR